MRRPTARDVYYRRFGLDGDPFPVTGVDQVLFLTPELERRLKLIRELIDDGRQLIVVSAPSGAGKSRLSMHVDSLAESNWTTALVRARDDMKDAVLAMELLEQFAPDLECTPDNAVNQLHKSLEYAAQRETVPVFIIDDAHRLPVATLDFIFQMAELRYGETRFHFILFAEESINDRFEDPAIMVIPSDSIDTIQLPALSESQTADYIRHRILSFGHIKKDPFSADSMRHTYLASRGLPGGINYLARQAMQKPPADQRRFGLILITAGLAAIAGMGWLTLTERPAGDLSDSVARVVPRGTGNAPVTDDGPAIAEETPEVTTVSSDTTDAPPANSIAPPADELPPGSEQNETTVAAEEDPAVEPGDDKQPAMEAAETAYTPTEKASRGAETVTQQTTAAPGQPDPGEEARSIAMEKETGAEASSETSTSPLTEPKKTPTDDETTGSATAAGHTNIFDLDETPAWAREIRGEDWLRNQPQDSVLLQIISASELENVRDLFDGLPEQPDLFSGFTNYTPSGKPRYRLYYGLYPDSDAAAAAVSGLPPRLRSLQPWPRPLENIIEELDDKKKRFNKK